MRFKHLMGRLIRWCIQVAGHDDASHARRGLHSLHPLAHLHSGGSSVYTFDHTINCTQRQWKGRMAR